MVKSTQLATAIRLLMMNYHRYPDLQRRAQKPRNEAGAVDYRLHAYAVSLPRYAYTVLTRDQSIDDSAHRFELATSRYLSRHIRSIDSFTFVATKMFIAQGLQYLILHFDFP